MMARETSEGRVGDGSECGPIVVVILTSNETEALTTCSNQTCVVVRQGFVDVGVPKRCHTERQVIHGGPPDTSSWKGAVEGAMLRSTVQSGILEGYQAGRYGEGGAVMVPG